MFRRFSTNFAVLSMFLDAGLIIVALTAANHLRPLLNTLPFTAEINEPIVPIPLYPIFAIIWVGTLLLHSVYDGRKNLHVYDEIANLFIASALAGVSLAGFLYLSYRGVSRALFLLFALLAFLFLLIWRLLVRLLFRLKAVQPSIRKVLIIGAGPVGQKLRGQINRHPHLKLHVIGFLDDNPSKWNMGDEFILGSVDEAASIVQQKQVDDVIIALPRWAHERVNYVVAELHKYPVKVWVIPDYFHLALHKATIEEFAGLPMLDLRAPALNEYQRFVKRAFDLTATFLMLPFALPVMGLIALAIFLEDRGPVFFRQKRVGENGKLFEMLKFRSMVPDAEQRLEEIIQQDEHGNIIHKTPHDPRVTRVGRFIRRISLDELPQLFNVLKGNMSLVGPRPELPWLVEKYEPWQRKRFAVPQGITGWWQINGRSDKPMHLNTEDDLYYIHNYSILLDLEIMLKTIWVVLRGKGAY